MRFDTYPCLGQMLMRMKNNTIEKLYYLSLEFEYRLLDVE